MLEAGVVVVLIAAFVAVAGVAAIAALRIWRDNPSEG